MSKVSCIGFLAGDDRSGCVGLTSRRFGSEVRTEKGVRCPKVTWILVRIFAKKPKTWWLQPSLSFVNVEPFDLELKDQIIYS